jgi:glutathione S-transferase
VAGSSRPEEAPLSGLPVLHQFPYSHFNEKARWGLDWKGVRHRRVTYLPGPHFRPIRRLSGQTATPVLELDGVVIPGSAAILDALERRFPERPLLPADPVLRARALELQRRFDDEFGPAVRTAVFSVLIEEPGYLCRIFATGQRAPVRWLYRAAFPLTRPLMARGNGVDDPAGVERAFVRVEEALDLVAREAGPTGPLAGEAFSIADLAAAALLAPLVEPGHPDMNRPRPPPERFAAFLARWREHPGARWVCAQYARHRPPSCATS